MAHHGHRHHGHHGLMGLAFLSAVPGFRLCLLLFALVALFGA